MLNLEIKGSASRQGLSRSLRLALIGLAFPLSLFAMAGAPKVGSKALNFELRDLQGKKLSLASQLRKGQVVLVVLRGWPGYQCPFCTRQVGSYMGQSKAFLDANAQVIFIYPGPAEGLKGHGEEFISGKDVPRNFHFLLDPDYSFTNLYDLRWNGPHETAYPSTFVLDRKGTVLFAKISHQHGDRADVSDVLKALKP